MVDFTRDVVTPAMAPFRQLKDVLYRYRPNKFRADLIAGLTVSVVAVPQSMAFALIAGVSPEYGLYTAIFQAIFGSLLSSSDHLSTGPTNTQSLLVAATVSRVIDGSGATYLQLVLGLTLLKGIVQLAFAVARMGNLVRYVSHSVIVGFTAGAGVLIIVGQIPNFLGVTPADTQTDLPGVLATAAMVLPTLGDMQWRSVVIGIAALAVVLGAARISKLVPGPLLAIVGTAAAVWAMGWQQQHLPLISPLPQGLPTPTLPQLSIEDYEALLGGAVAIALLGMLESVAIAKSIAGHTGQRINANQEFFSQGLTNTLTSFLGCIPGSGSFSRSALNFSAGAKTRFAGVFNGLFVAGIFLLAAPLAKYVPLASLAAILFVIAAGLIDWQYMVRLSKTSKADMAVCMITFAAALLTPLAYAIYIGIFLNIALYLRRASELHLAEMVQSPSGPFMERPVRDRAGDQKVIFLQAEGNLFFGVADELQDRLTAVSQSGVRVVILRLKRTHSIDSTVLTVLERFVKDMQSRDGYVLICGIRPDLLERLRGFGLTSLIGEDNIFEAGFGVFTSAKRALQRARHLLQSSLDTDAIPEANEIEGWAYEI